MNSNSGYNDRKDRGSDGRRNNTRWDVPESQNRPPPYDQIGSSGFPGPPQGKHTLFGDSESRKDTLATGSKRERSRERNSHEKSRSYRRDRDRDVEEHGSRRSSAEPSKRLKREPEASFSARRDPIAEVSKNRDTPAIPGDFQVASSDLDELGTMHRDILPTAGYRPPTVESSQFNSKAAEATPEPRKPGLFDLGRRAIQNFLAKPQEKENASAEFSSNGVQDALEAAALGQAELQYMAEELEKARDKCRELQEQAQTLHASEQKAQNELKRLTAEHAELAAKCSQQSKYVDQANAHIDKMMAEHEDTVKKYETRVKGLVQLKQPRTLPDARPPQPGPKADNISLDPFDNKLDQVSEATVKGGVESLNDSLDNFTMILIDEAEELASQNSHSRIRPLSKSTTRLPSCSRHWRIDELDRLFCSGEVLSRVMDPRGLSAFSLRELTKRASGNVRALTPKIRSRLETIYNEANQLSIMARRDVLSVRMAVVVGADAKGNHLPYDPNSMASVWPDMKLVDGDEVIALYKFGLKKSNEKGQLARLIKPEVVTTALLRDLAKN
ncbi:hypothetical protein K438DRAFT_1779861 [Mycena galopus ATCC 62051]|nr:hypothetical protein K438DRAFT_1779861 [Mycena galopus ATCC 62051]